MANRTTTKAQPVIDHDDGTRTCNDCGARKPLVDFPKDRNATLGRRSRCKPCHSARQTARYRADPTIRERCVAARRAVIAADPEAAKAEAKADYDRHRETRLERQSAYTHARRARLAGVQSDPTISIVALRKRDGDLCRYCGIVVDFTPCIGRQLRSATATIDHVVPISRGGPHTWVNVVLACWACNGAKGTRTLHEWRQAAASA